MSKYASDTLTLLVCENCGRDDRFTYLGLQHRPPFGFKGKCDSRGYCAGPIVAVKYRKAA